MDQQQGKLLLLGSCLLGTEYAIFSFWSKTNGVQSLCVKHTSVCSHLLDFPEKTICGLGSITRSWLEKIVLLWHWNYLGSWSLGTKAVQMQDLLRGQENLLRLRPEWRPVGVPPGKTQSGTFCCKLLYPIQYTTSSVSAFLIFFLLIVWLVGFCVFIFTGALNALFWKQFRVWRQLSPAGHISSSHNFTSCYPCFRTGNDCAVRLENNVERSIWPWFEGIKQ